MADLISSAERLTGEGKKARLDRTAQAWQTESWQRFKDGGEYNAAATWIATQESRMVIVPQQFDATTGEWISETDPVCLAKVREMGNQAELFRTWGFNSVIAAEAMWVFVNDRWQLVSRASIEAKSNGQFYFNGYGTTDAALGPPPSLPLVRDCYRVFLPAPDYPMLSHTPVSAFLKDLEQLYYFRANLTSKLKARFWMNGIWIFGQKVTMATQQGRRTPGARGKFLDDLRLLIGTNMQRKLGAADAEPILMQTATPDVGDVVKMIYPEVAIDEREASLRREVRATLREMFDLPVEQQTSKADLNHWGTWSVREENITDSLEPRAQALLDALSASWYYDQLVGEGMKPEEAVTHRLVVSSAKLKPPPSSDEVRQAHDRGEASGDALRAATRMPEEARPDDAERLRILGFKKGNPYLATWGTELHKQIDWELVARLNSPGRPGTDAGEVERAPGVGEPGSPEDPVSEVDDDED